MATKKVKPKPGTEAAARAKEIFRFDLIGTLIIILVFCCQYIFKTDLSVSNQQSGLFLNILGVIFYGGSVWWLWNAAKFDGVSEKIHPGVFALLLLALGMLTGVASDL